MSKTGLIILVDDDLDDQEIFESIVEELEMKNKVRCFPEARSAYEFLSTTKEIIFIIFCDINMPGKNGLEFKRELDANPYLRKKSIPFLFYSTQASQKDINEAYLEMSIQGFFKKGAKYGEIKLLLKRIFDYWVDCKHPNSQESSQI